MKTHTYELWDVDDMKERLYTTNEVLKVGSFIYLVIGGRNKRVLVQREVEFEGGE